MQRLLDELRRRVDPGTRQRESGRWSPGPPTWLRPSDDLFATYRDRPQLLDEGEITWAQVFMAHSELWEPGDDDNPIGVVYSFDPWFQRRPERLVAIGRRLYAFHGSEERPPRRPWERAIRDSLRTGLERPLHEELPPSLAGGRVAYHSSTIGCRAHLPTGQLDDTLLPLLVQRDRTPSVCMPVPSHYWPSELLSRWSS